MYKYDLIKRNNNYIIIVIIIIIHINNNNKYPTVNILKYIHLPTRNSFKNRIVYLLNKQLFKYK